MTCIELFRNATKNTDWIGQILKLMESHEETATT